MPEYIVWKRGHHQHHYKKRVGLSGGHHINDSEKHEDAQLRRAAKESSSPVEDRPMPLIDIGLERLQELVVSVIGEDAQDKQQRAWLRIINEYPASEEAVIELAREVKRLPEAQTGVAPSIEPDETPKRRQRTGKQIVPPAMPAPAPSLPQYDACKFIKEQTEVRRQSLADELLDLIWTNPFKSHAAYLKEGSRCPRCKTGLIISNWHSSVCLNCGLSEDYGNRYTLMEEHLVNWLVRNSPRRFSPPKWLLDGESHAGIHSAKKRITDANTIPELVGVKS